MSRHLKRYFSPNTWKVKRKGIVFTTKPSPGPHRMNRSLPLSIILREVLKYANTNREVKFILEKSKVAVDNIIRKNYKFPVGLFDVLSLHDINEHFRIILDKKGKISLIKIGKEESMLKPSKIVGKKAIKGKLQLNLHDGKNIIVTIGDYKVGDTVLLNLEDRKYEIKEVVKLDKSSLIFLTGGKHIGQIGKVQDIIGGKIIYATKDGEVIETLRKYAFTIGKDKPLISLDEK